VRSPSDWCNTFVALDTPLNQRQVDVLRWIADRCPAGHWADFTYKTTAKALEWRGLIVISRQGGRWEASILPAGTHYLETGNYPSGHRLHRVRPARTPTVSLKIPQPRRGPRPPVAEVKPTHQLVKDIIDAGGVLERNLADETHSYKHLVAIINSRQFAPDDQQVIINDWVRPGRIVLRLSNILWDWKTGPIPQRLGKLHPVAAQLRTEQRFDGISTSTRSRAYRLVHALALEAEARGHKVRTSKRPGPYGYGEQIGGIVGCVVFDVGRIHCAMSLTESQDRVPHIATDKELARAKRDTWYNVPTHDYVKSGRLNITLATDSGYNSKVTWKDTEKIQLESRLCDVIPLFECWAAFDAERKEAERQSQIAAQERRRHEDEVAVEEYTQRVLADQLVADLNAWECAGRLRQYLAALETRAGEIADEEDRSAAAEWLEWCQNYIAKQDPLTRPIRMPMVKAPDYRQLQDVRRSLGFGYW
jgi:hypothetical protein